jgi:hypothetical protein
MAQTGFTPIQLYRSTTASAVPSASNLTPGELAININDADMALYAENASGVVKKIMNNPAGLTYPTADGTAGQLMATDGAGNVTFTSTVSVTTVDTTNIEVTNIKAKDGTSAGSIADSTGVVTLASSVLTTTDINGGTIDGTTIGGASAGAGTFTTATATTGNITTVNATTVDSTNLEVTNIKAKDGTASATIADSTGVMTIASSVLTTTDINGGTVDGAVIGGSSAAAITGTTITATGDVSIEDKIVHTGDTNTAIRFPAADTVTVETSGTERLRITSTGLVGIGTTNPGQALSVNGSIDILAATTETRQLQIGQGRTGDGVSVIDFITDATYTDFGLRISRGAGANADSFINARGTGTLNIRTAEAGPLLFSTNATERLRIDASGNVGIGTTAPSAKLEVIGAVDGNIANFTDFTRADLTIDFPAASVSRINSRSGDNPAALVFSRGVSKQESARIDSSGNVGIGTSSPSSKLQVAGTVTATGYAGTVDGTNAVGFRNIPPVGTKTTSYTLQTADVGKYVQVGSGGSITVPNATFAEGDAVSIFNNTSGNITITCSITTAYIGGANSDVASVTLATRGVANVLFISGTVAVLTGNIS